MLIALGLLLHSLKVEGKKITWVVTIILINAILHWYICMFKILALLWNVLSKQLCSETIHGLTIPVGDTAHQLWRGQRSLDSFSPGNCFGVLKNSKLGIRDWNSLFPSTWQQKRKHNAVILLRGLCLAGEHLHLLSRQWLVCLSPCEAMTRGIGITASVMFAFQLSSQKIDFILKC